MATVKNQIEQTLSIWDKVEIIIEEDNERGVYMSRIEDFAGDQIKITKPEYQSGSILIRERTELKALIIKQDAVYQFTTKIRRRGESPDFEYYLELPDDINRFQRRNFVRIEDFTAGTYSPVDPQMSAVRAGWYPYRTENISGSGILIKTPKEIKIDDLVLINHELLKLVGLELPLLAICRRSFVLKRQHFYGLEFIRDDRIANFFENNKWQYLPQTVLSFDLDHQERLASHIFKKQVKLRKEGLL